MDAQEACNPVTIEEQIRSLELLAAIDSELKDLDERLKTDSDELSTKKTELNQLEEKLASHNASIEEMERMRADLIQEVRQMSVQVERSREKLARCRTEREANAAQREVEEIRKLYRDRELEIEKLVGLVDQARVDLDATTAKRDELANELGSSEGEVATRIREIEESMGAKRSEREGITKGIKPQLYRRYEMIRKRKGSALAWTNDGSCSACHMALPPMVFQELRRRQEFGQCPSCHRIIYYRGDQELAESRSSGP